MILLRGILYGAKFTNTGANPEPSTSTNKFVIAFEEKKTIAEWTRDKRCEVSSQTLGKRLKRGIKPENALLSIQKPKNTDGE